MINNSSKIKPLSSSKDRISVIMPCYNSEAYLREAIHCVFNQSYKNTELIVVNDGSTDKSSQILLELSQQYPNLTVINQINQGPFPARNLALQHSTGSLIAFLDADDFWAPDCLEKLYNSLTQSNADLSYCGWQNIIEDGDNGPPYIPPDYQQGNFFHSFLKSCPWPIHAALTRKTIINQVNGFSTRCFSAMDYDLWIRMSAVTQNMVLVPEVLAFYRWHNQGQISSIKWKQLLHARIVRNDFIANNPLLISHISKQKQDELINAPISKQAYVAFWKRDLVSAQQLFRAMFSIGCWQIKDLKYIILSFLPATLFKRIILFLDK